MPTPARHTSAPRRVVEGLRRPSATVAPTAQSRRANRAPADPILIDRKALRDSHFKPYPGVPFLVDREALRDSHFKFYPGVSYPPVEQHDEYDAAPAVTPPPFEMPASSLGTPLPAVLRELEDMVREHKRTQTHDHEDHDHDHHDHVHHGHHHGHHHHHDVHEGTLREAIARTLRHEIKDHMIDQSAVGLFTLAVSGATIFAFPNHPFVIGTVSFFAESLGFTVLGFREAQNAERENHDGKIKRLSDFGHLESAARFLDRSFRRAGLTGSNPVENLLDRMGKTPKGRIFLDGTERSIAKNIFDLWHDAYDYVLTVVSMSLFPVEKMKVIATAIRIFIYLASVVPAVATEVIMRRGLRAAYEKVTKTA